MTVFFFKALKFELHVLYSSNFIHFIFSQVCTSVQKWKMWNLWIFVENTVFLCCNTSVHRSVRTNQHIAIAKLTTKTQRVQRWRRFSWDSTELSECLYDLFKIYTSASSNQESVYLCYLFYNVDWLFSKSIM